MVDQIQGLVGGTGDQIVALANSDKDQRRLIGLLYAAFAMGAVLIVGMAIGGFMLNDLAKKVQHTQEVTRDGVLCPLFEQFILADTPESRARAEAAGQDLKARDQAFKEIRQSYQLLQCN